VSTLYSVGGSLGKTKKLVTYTSSRFSKKFPLVLRTRDIFGAKVYHAPVLNFKMEIPVFGSKQQTSLTLYFYEGLCCNTGGSI
jgi:hypothetical protein